MKRLFKKQMNKRPNKKRRIILLVTGLLLVVGVGTYFWYQSQQGVSGSQYEKVLSEVQQDIAAQNYSEAKSKLAKLERSSGGDKDYRVYAYYADIANYKKNINEAKSFAEKAIALSENASDFQRSSGNELILRMESYMSGTYLPNPSEEAPSYEVPAERIKDSEFQG